VVRGAEVRGRRIASRLSLSQVEEMAEQKIGDLERIRVNIEAWLRKTIAERPHLQVGELEFPTTSGESSVTLMLETTFGGGRRERFVLRMVPPRSEVFESHDLLMQYRMMEAMRQEGVPVPPLVGYEPDASLLGSDFYVMEFVDGQIPPDNPPMAFGSWVLALGAAQRRTMWQNGLDVLAAIHRTDVGRHDFSRLPRAARGEPLVAAELRKFDSMFKPELRAIADPHIEPAWQWLLANPPPSSDVGLCWGDSRVGNMIWRDLRPVAVIDWEMANLADPLSDLAWWVWIDRCNSIGLGADKMEGVPEPHEIYAQWHDRSGRSIEHIAYFELLTVVRYAIILELKFVAMRNANPDAGTIPNFVVPFIEPLWAAAR
jgi:aminoglycoside phosphotransferase (APT) family kinase protein